MVMVMGPGGVFNYWFVPTRPDRASVPVGTVDKSAYTIGSTKQLRITGPEL